jgi:hypothetical protein
MNRLYNIFIALVLLITCGNLFVASFEVREEPQQQLRGGNSDSPVVENVAQNVQQTIANEAKNLLRDFNPPKFVSRKDKNYKKAMQKLQLASGTDVTIFADSRLTKAEMFKVADHVIKMTKGNVMRCFCRYTLANVGKVLTTSQKRSTAGDQANVQCSCAPIGPGGSAALDGPEYKAKDFYGTPIAFNTTLTERLRYPLPKASVYDIPTEGLLISLDAGDKKSFDSSKPHEWKDCSESESKYAKVPAEIHGFVGFNETMGGGSLRIGAHDDRDVIVLKGLDVSARNIPALSVEIWVKLEHIRKPRGRAFGNVLSGYGGRALNLHDTRYGPQASTPVPPIAVNPSFCAKNGRVALTAGHPYNSNVKPATSHEWTQYVGVYDSAGKRNTLYIDGKWKNQEDIHSDGSTEGSKDFAIGNHQYDHKSGTFKLDGYIGLVRIYDRILKEEDVNTLYEHSKDRFGHGADDEIP